MNSHVHFVLSALVFTAAVAVLKANDAPEPRALTHTASETVRIPATRARLTVIVESEANNPATAQQVVAQRSNTLRDFLRGSKVDHLQAGAMTLHPIHDTPSPPYGPTNTGEITGYRAQWHATFELEAEQAGRIVGGAVSAGAARVTNFEFTTADAVLSNAQRDAFRRAAVRARDDAHAILEALGYKPGEILKVTVNSGPPVFPLSRRFEMAATSPADLAPATSAAVEPGFVQVTGSVTLEVAY